jgi:hypothetical protein
MTGVNSDFIHNTLISIFSLLGVSCIVSACYRLRRQRLLEQELRELSKQLQSPLQKVVQETHEPHHTSPLAHS